MGHTWHCFAPEVSLYSRWLSLHTVHEEEPLNAAYLLASHCWQEMAPGELVNPAGQCGQCEVGGSVPMVPALHGLEEVLLWVMCQPSATGIAIEPPVPAMAPRATFLHTVALVSFWYKPVGQFSQRVALGLGLKVPWKQGRQEVSPVSF